MNQLLSTLFTELKSAIANKSLTLPNSAVTSVDVSDFLKNTLKTDDISFTDAAVSYDGDATVTLTGDWSVFGVSLSLTWTFTDADGAISWSISATATESSSVKSVITHFLNSVPSMPVAVSDLALSNFGLTVDVDQSSKDYQLTLDAKSTWGEVTLEVEDDSGEFGAAIGLEFDDTLKVSEISGDLGIFDDLNFSKSAIIISDYKNDDLTLAGITGVDKGIEFASTLTLSDSGSSSSPLVTIVNQLAKTLSSTPIDITIDLSASEFKLDAHIDESFGLPGFSKFQFSGADFTVDTTPSVSLSGHIDIPVKITADPDVTSIGVDGAVSFTYSDGTGTIEATLNSATVITYPFDFKGVTLKDVGVGMDVSFGVETGAGVTFEGDFVLGTEQLEEKFAITIDFDDDLPNPSLLYVESKNLSLATIFNGLIDPSLKLPSILSGFAFTDLVIYWCDRAQVLPDGTDCQVGYGYNAAINFWGFDTYSALMIENGSGISGQASIDPISLVDGAIAITGNGVAGHGVKAGGAYFDFDTSKESFDANLDAKILGLSEVASAAISSDSFKISMNTNLGFLDDTVDAHFSSLDNMGFSSSLDISINCKPSIKIGNFKIGTIHIDTSFSGSVSVSVDGTKFSAGVSGKFTWNSYSFGFKYDISDNLKDLSDIASAIEQKIVSEAESIFSSYFTKVEHYIDAFGKGLLTDGDFFIDVLYNVYSHTVDDILDDLADLPDKVHVDGDPTIKLKLAPGVPSETVHIDLGKILNIHGDLLVVNSHADLNASKSIKTPALTVTLLDIDAGDHFDLVMPPSVHADVSSPHIDVGEHLDIKVAGGKFDVGGSVGVNTDVSLNDPEFSAHLNLKGKVSVHGDVAHIGGHGDTSSHTDKTL